MKEIKILNLFPDLLDLYSDYGNIKILKYRLEKRNINVIIDTYKIGDAFPSLLDYDLIFLGGGSLNNQETIYSNLINYKDDFKKAIEVGIFLLLIDSSYQLFGSIEEDDNMKYKGLEILPYKTKLIERKPIIGNVTLDVDFENLKTRIYGFENHSSEVSNNSSPLGTVLEGIGNDSNALSEGYFNKNVLATFLHGPLLSLNPELSDYIIKYCLNRKYNEQISLDPLDDTFENQARSQKSKNSNL